MKVEVPLLMSHCNKAVSCKQQSVAFTCADAMSELRPSPTHCKAHRSGLRPMAL